MSWSCRNVSVKQQQILKCEVGTGFVLMSPDSMINKDGLERERTDGRMLIREGFEGREK